MNRPARCTEADVKRAVKGVIAAGLTPTRVRIDNTGVIDISVDPDDHTEAGLNEWDVK